MTAALPLEVLSLGSVEVERPTAHASQQVGHLANLTVRRLRLEPGFEHPEWCDRGHAGYVLEGRLDLVLADSTTTLVAGDAFLVRSGEAAAHRPLPGPDGVTMLLVDDVG